jgi:hypothetical protein
MISSDYRKFAEFVRVQARSARFLADDDERDLLQEGLRHFHVQSDEGRWILLGVAADEEIAVENVLDRWIARLLGRFAKTDGKIKKAEFEDAVEIYKDWSNHRFSDDEIKKKLKTIVEKEKLQAKRNGLLRSRRWFRKIETD